MLSWMRSTAAAIALAWAIGLLAVPGGDALAQYGSGSDGRNEAGRFDYYALVLSWSPTYCAVPAAPRYDPQCNRAERAYAFVLHGLWPQHERGWPQDCRSASAVRAAADHRPHARHHAEQEPGDPRVPQARHLLGPAADGYFDFARKLYDKIKIPAPLRAASTDDRSTSPGEVMSDFIAANPAAEARHDRGGAAAGPATACARCASASTSAATSAPADATRTRRGCARADRMYVPPVRVGARSARPGEGDATGTARLARPLAPAGPLDPAADRKD